MNQYPTVYIPRPGREGEKERKRERYMHILLLHIFCHIKKPRKKRARQKREIIKKGGNGWNKTGKRIKTSDIIFKFLEITAFFLPFKIGGP